jgi:MFS family permease
MTTRWGRASSCGPAAAEPVSTAGPWVAAVCLVGGALPLADLGLVNVAVPRIASDLGLGSGQVKALVAAYIVAFGVFLVPGGRLGDRFGRRLLFRLGLASFVAGAVASALAQAPAQILVARMVQGAAAGLLSPQVGGLLQAAFSGQRRARAIGALGSSIAVATAVGPVLGGLFIGLGAGVGSWRWAFCVDLLAVVPLAASGLLPAHSRRVLPDLDVVGTALLALAALFLLLPVVLSVTATTAVLWVAAVVVVTFLAGWERHYLRSGRSPLLAPALLGSRSWVRGVVVIGLFLAGSTALPVLVSLQAQVELGLSPLQAGLLLIPYAAGSAVGAAAGGRWVLRAGGRIVTAGCLMFVAGLAVALVVGPPGGGRVPPVPGAVGWLVLLFVTGAGTGLVITPNQTLSYEGVPVDQASNASALLLTAQRLGSAVGVSVTTALFYRGADASTTTAMAVHGTRAAIATLMCLAIAALVVTLGFGLAGGRRFRAAIEVPA